MLKKRIAFIGSGVMAEAMIAGTLRKKLVRPEDLSAAGPRPERAADLKRKYAIQTTTDNAAAVRHADLVVLSVKPQRLSEVMKGLRGIRPEALVLSIVAGASIRKLAAGLKHQGDRPLDAEYSWPDWRRHYGLDRFARYLRLPAGAGQADPGGDGRRDLRGG